MMYHVSNKFLRETNLPPKFRYFHFSVSSSNFLTAFWLVILVSAESSHTILLINRYEPRFKSRAGGKISKTLKKKNNLLIFG